MGIWADQSQRTDDPEHLEVAPDASPLDFLFAVYRDPQQPMTRRLKAACEAAQYVHPTFKATAMVVAEGLKVILPDA